MNAASMTASGSFPVVPHAENPIGYDPQKYPQGRKIYFLRANTAGLAHVITEEGDDVTFDLEKGERLDVRVTHVRDDTTTAQLHAFTQDRIV